MKNEEKRASDFKKNRTLINSFNDAINGIIKAINTEKNMKIHLFMAIFVIVISVLLDFSRTELIIIAISAALVIVAEIFNTAIEELTDLVTDEKYNVLAGRVKDMSAGAVFVLAINSLFVGYLLILPKLDKIFTSKKILLKVMDNYEYLIIISVVAVFLFTLLFKGIFYKKDTTHLQGGVVSGHSAIAFNLAVIGSILVKNYIVTILFLLVALIVVESRVESKIHTIKEVVLGSLLGIAVAFILFFRFI